MVSREPSEIADGMLRLAHLLGKSGEEGQRDHATPFQASVDHRAHQTRVCQPCEASEAAMCRADAVPSASVAHRRHDASGAGMHSGRFRRRAA
jgi:hypothetical protein